MSNPFLEAALANAARGFRVFPLRENGTRPVYEGWPEWATTDPVRIRALWEGSRYNVGICTTGMLVVDIDTKQGRAGLASWDVLHGAWDTYTVRTRSGGFHLYYAGADVGLSVGALGPGLDIRSHNGYVVAPGSVVNGQGYEIAIDRPLALAPDHIVARCKPPGFRSEHADIPAVDLDSPAAMHAAQERIARTPAAMPGERSDATYRLACAVRELGVSEPVAAALMAEWGDRCSPPISPEDLGGIVANAYLYAQNQAGTKAAEAQFAGIVIEAPPPLPPQVPALQQVNGHWGNALVLDALTPRPHVLRGLLMSTALTGLLAPGGVGKSLLMLCVAAHLAVGRDFLTFKNMLGRPSKSILYNAEDSLNEMSMRLHAICSVCNLPFEAVQDRVRLISGKTHGKVRFVTGAWPNQVLNEAAIREFVQVAADPEVSFVGFDPLNRLHTMNGSDNNQMTYVMDVLETLCEQAQVAGMLAHHTSKPSFGVKRAGNADSSQGAGAIVNSARYAFTLFPPEDEDITKFGLTPAERKMLLRLDYAKQNYGAAGDDTLWLRRVPVQLWMGEEVPGLESTDMHVRTEHLRQMIAKVLAVGMIHTRGTAGVKLNDAAALLKAGDPLFEKLALTVIKQRIQSYLAEPCTIEDGSVVVCEQNAEGWMVVLR